MVRRVLRPVPPNEGGTLGTVAFDAEAGTLELSGLAVQALQRDRERVGDDRAFGRMLIADGWSNGQLYLVTP